MKNKLQYIITIDNIKDVENVDEKSLKFRILKSVHEAIQYENSKGDVKIEKL